MTDATIRIAASSGTVDPFAALTSQGSASAVRLPKGTIVNGRYELRRLIGAGGMGTVYEVNDALHPERQVALKTIQGAVFKPDRLSLFKSEFKTMVELRHPNVASVYDFEPMHGSADHFFTMEYIAGRDLMQASERASCNEIVELLVQVCRALSYLHSRKIVHFDVKPANILVDAERRVRVLDFGVAGTGHGNMILGTPAYIAPEMMGAEAAVDHRADLYSLGIVLYQLLARRVPFSGASVAMLLQKHATEPVVFDAETRASWPDWLRHVALRLCAKTPAERYRSANAVIEDINLLSGSCHQIETAATKESYILSSRFVGRERELERTLEYVWGKTGALTNALPGAMLVAGVSGVGKSRFIREVKHHAQLAGLPFVEGSCYEGGFSALDPIAAALRHVARLARSAQADELLARHAPALAGVDPALVPGTRAQQSASEDERRVLIDELGSFCVDVAERVPYVLYLNDLQWSRADLIDLMSNLVRRLSWQQGKRAKLALLGSYRPDEVDGRPLAKLLGERGVETIALQPLDVEHIRRLLGSMLGIDDIPDAFVQRVAVETAGVPFFVEEVMRSLVDRGSVYLEHGKWAADAAVGELEIPATITSVFRRRTSLLQADARALFEIMAVCGRPMPARTLAVVMQTDDETIFRLLRSLHDRQMVARLGGEELLYGIGHDRMRETLYAELSADRRRELHRDVARVLEQSGGDAHAIAHHYWFAEEREPALRYALLAGDEAQHTNATARAIEQFTRAHSLLDEASRRSEPGMQIAEKLGDLEVLTGNYTSALVRYRYVLGASHTRIDSARLLRKVARQQFETGELTAAVESASNAIAVLTGRKPRLGLLSALLEHLRHRIFGWSLERDPVKREHLMERGRCYGLLARAFFFRDATRAPVAMMRACSAIERGGDSSDLCAKYNEIGFLYNYLGLTGSAASFGDRAVAIAERLGTPLDIAAASVFRGMIYSNGGDFVRAVPLCERGKALLLKHGDIMTLTVAESNVSNMLFWRGHVREAAESSEHIVHVVDRTGSQGYGKTIIAWAAYFRAIMDGSDHAAGFEQSYESARTANDMFSLIMILALRGHAEWVQGRIGEALVTAAEAQHIIKQSKSRYYLTPLVYTTAALAMMEGDAKPNARTWQLIRRALRYTKRLKQFRATALTARAVYEWKRDRRARAKKLFAEATAFATKQGNVWALHEARLLDAIVSGDANRLEEAREALKRLEMHAYLRPRAVAAVVRGVEG